MPSGHYLSIGLNSVDPAGYDGWSGPLNACENDARSIADLAIKKGFTGKALLTSTATSLNVLSELESASNNLTGGDILLVMYSGHGGQVEDINRDETDDLDETWCLFDRMLIDDELYALWSKFKPGVRILVLSDSCHSGTVLRALQYRNLGKAIPEYRETSRSVKVIPFDKSWKIYQKRKVMYDSLQSNAGPKELSKIDASVLLISGCQDNQLSLDGDPNGLFTGTLLEVWNNGNYQHGYRNFHKDIVSRLPPSQTPNLMIVGAPNSAFEKQTPFSI